MGRSSNHCLCTVPFYTHMNYYSVSPFESNRNECCPGSSKRRGLEICRSTADEVDLKALRERRLSIANKVMLVMKP